MSILSIPAQQSFAGVVKELEQDEVGQWRDLSESVGARLLPVLEDVITSLPSSTIAMVCTADGFNLCALGLEETQVDRVSAMASSLYSVAAAATAATGDTDHDSMSMVTLSHGAQSTVVMAVDGLPLGPALLWVTGQRESLGAIIYRTREAAGRMPRALRER
jgi:predicted regulator of Ras-like GTPase activity (Roadblock/LC7/MglB family)